MADLKRKIFIAAAVIVAIGLISGISAYYYSYYQDHKTKTQKETSKDESKIKKEVNQVDESTFPNSIASFNYYPTGWYVKEKGEDVSIQDRPGTVWLGGGIAPKNVQDITYTGRIISVVKKELDGKPFNEWLRDENENHVIKNGYPVPEHIDGLDGFRFVYSEEISADMPFIYVSNGFSVYIIRFESSGGESDSEGLRVFEEVIKSLNLN